MCLALAINRSAEQMRNKLPKLTSLIPNMTVAFCKVPTSVVAFQEKIPTTTVTPQLILARLCTWLKEVKSCGENPNPTEEIVQAFPDTDDAAKKKKFFFVFTFVYHASCTQFLFQPTMHNIYFLF